MAQRPNRFLIELPPQLHERLAALVAHTGRNRAELIRQALTEYLERQETKTVDHVYRTEITGHYGTSYQSKLPRVFSADWDEFVARLTAAGYTYELLPRFEARLPDPPYAPGAGGRNAAIGTLYYPLPDPKSPRLNVGSIRYGEP